jgi:hypothetical protein
MIEFNPIEAHILIESSHSDNEFDSLIEPHRGCLHGDELEDEVGDNFLEVIDPLCTILTAELAVLTDRDRAWPLLRSDCRPELLLLGFILLLLEGEILLLLGLVHVGFEFQLVVGAVERILVDDRLENGEVIPADSLLSFA